MSMLSPKSEGPSKKLPESRPAFSSGDSNSSKTRLEFYRFLSKHPFYPSAQDRQSIAQHLARIWR